MKGITCPKCDEYILTAPRKKELKAQPAEVRDLKTLIHSIYDVHSKHLLLTGILLITKYCTKENKRILK